MGKGNQSGFEPEFLDLQTKSITTRPNQKKQTSSPKFFRLEIGFLVGIQTLKMEVSSAGMQFFSYITKLMI